MPGRIQSIERAAAILRLLSGRTRRLAVAELAGELGLPKGTVYGILRTSDAVTQIRGLAVPFFLFTALYCVLGAVVVALLVRVFLKADHAG